MMRLTSPAYGDGEEMPARSAATAVPGGRDLSIPLAWDGAPAGTRSFAVAVIDRHPVARGFVHWLVTDIPAGANGLEEGASSGHALPAGAVELTGTSGTAGYHGPRPPAGTGLHDYETTVFALDVEHLSLGRSDGWEDMSAAMRHHVLDSASLLGRFGA